MVKGFRKEEIKADFIQKIKDTLTPEEATRLEEMRSFDTLKPSSMAYKLALHNDTLRVNIRNQKEQVWKHLWNIKDITNKIVRANVQLISGEIYETIGEKNIVMNKDELASYIEHMTWVKKGEVRAINKLLLQMRGNVGHIDIQKNIIMTEEEYENYVKEIELKLKDLKHDLFE